MHTLRDHVHPRLGQYDVAGIDTSHVLDVLKPIWLTTPETASRVRGRIEAILDWARAHGFRSGENPARWRWHLALLLPPRSKVAKVRHHPALRFSEMNDFMQQVRAQTGLASLALQLTILTALRTNEVLAAQWDEVDIEAGIWSVPAARMKCGKEHRVPLSMHALQVLRLLLERRASEFIFPSRISGKHLSNMAMLELLRRMNRNDITVHGFRSTFRDWAAELTDYSHEVVEMALAHSVGNKVEAAYRRGDLFAKRSCLMSDWGAYCCAPKLQSAEHAPKGSLSSIG